MGKPFPSLPAFLGPFLSMLCPNRSPRAGMEYSEASGAEKQGGDLCRQLHPGEQEEGRIPHCPFQREKGQSPEWKCQAGQETPPASLLQAASVRRERRTPACSTSPPHAAET